MRDAQAGLLDESVAIEQQIQVDLAGPPPLPPDAAHLLLDRLQPLQRGAGGEQRPDPDHRIEIARLGRTDGLALVCQRHLAQREPRLAREQGDGRRQVRQPVAQIGSQADERLDHGTASRRNRSSIAYARCNAGSGQLSPR